MRHPSRPTCLSWATVAVAFVALTSAAIAESWNEYPVPKLARPGVAPGGRTGATPKIWIPLPKYLHPFHGELVLKHKDWDGNISSFAHKPAAHRCVVTITRIGSGGIGPQAWMCAFISEVASCNGAPDVNGDQLNADGSHMSFLGQMAYAGRSCGTMDIPRIYKAVGGY